LRVGLLVSESWIVGPRVLHSLSTRVGLFVPEGWIVGPQGFDISTRELD
jgi:hypothetical protein